MIANDKSERTDRLCLKKSANWFAAGEGFLKAMEILTDGAFKLFVYLCLKADRHSATYRTSGHQLAHALRKPLDTIESSLAQMEAKKVCSIVSNIRSEGECLIRIQDEFWPYYSSGRPPAGQYTTDYVAAVRRLFLSLGCTSGRFGSSEETQARSLQKRGIPLDIVRDAMMMAACRKYISWLNNGYSEPISSIAYFESVIGEFLRCPPSADYRENLPSELKRLSKDWSRTAPQNPPIQGVPDYRPHPDCRSWGFSEADFPDRVSKVIQNDSIGNPERDGMMLPRSPETGSASLVTREGIERDKKRDDAESVYSIGTCHE